MKTLVVDASVAAKWFFAEEHADLAARLLTDNALIFAPDLIIAEFGNIVWKRARRGELMEDEAGDVIRNFLRLPLQLISPGPLIENAIRLGLTTGRTVYDCTYLAVAIVRDCRLVTGDRKFFDALARGPFSKRVHWIGREH